MGSMPERLKAALRPVTVVVGHYGTGKTNFCMNLAVDAATAGYMVTVIDLDVVNPYFRASEQRNLLESHGIRLIAPVYAEAGTSLDVPSLTGQIGPAIQAAREGELVIIDAGGDDVGATALGRYARFIQEQDHCVLCIANRFRNLVQDHADAIENLREIEVASRLRITGLVNNSHLKAATTVQTVEQGVAYADELCALTGIPLVCTTVPKNIVMDADDTLYPIECFIKNPWE
ncbi:MAG: ParA family protein [Eggerthellaceae bacterium]|nr:ParA family protein [Eggerthellaceae bacterium]